jgi:hypothetical protein
MDHCETNDHITVSFQIIKSRNNKHTIYGMTDYSLYHSFETIIIINF